MLKFDVDFYDDNHRGWLKVNCGRFDRIEELVNQGFEVEKEELFSYSVFVEQKQEIDGWRSYRDLQEKLPQFRGAWELSFEFSDRGVHAKFDARQIRVCHKEALGVGGALAIVSRVYDLTEADWEMIPVGPVKDLDFKIASAGTHFVEVEAKSDVVPDCQKSHLSDHKRDIEEKKRVQRQQGNKNM